MPRKGKLKVYGANVDGVHRVILATMSIANFSVRIGVSRASVVETGNEIERGVALNEPGAIFVRSERSSLNRPYRRMGTEFSWRFLEILRAEERE